MNVCTAWQRSLCSGWSLLVRFFKGCSIHPSIHPIQSNPKPDHRAHRHCIFVIILIQVGGVCGWACADLLATLDRFLQFHWFLLLVTPLGSFSSINLLDPSPPIPPPGQFLPFSSTGWAVSTISRSSMTTKLIESYSEYWQLFKYIFKMGWHFYHFSFDGSSCSYGTPQ